MLIQLKLKNIALIEIIEINFEKGLNIITGDSGSGKSLILDSLNVLFGGTNIPLKHLIRPGKKECLIEAKFSNSSKLTDWFSRNGFKEISDEIFVKRQSYKKNNKIHSKYTINNLSVNKKVLGKLGLLLVDFAGQSDTFLYDNQDYRRRIIDDLGSKRLKKINFDIKSLWQEFQILKKRREEKKEAFKKKEENNFAIQEMFKMLEEANLNSKSEISELQSKELRLSSNFDIKNSIQLSLDNLNSYNNDSSVSYLIAQSIKQLSKVSQFDSKIKDLNDDLISIQNDVENLIFALTKYSEQLENEDFSLEEVQKRLFYLQNLERTFSLELPDLILKRNELKTFIEDNLDEEEIKKLDIQINKLEVNLNTLFEIQSSQRKETADQLQNSVISILKNLGLENADFSIEFSKVASSSEGNETIDFLFSANPDQKLAPLSKIISGGEMSRFLLAIKSSISQKSNTFFLDEIDNGLSGKSLYSLVELIKATAQDRQVLCITHQPLLAATGNSHFKVKKNVINGITFTSVLKLNTKRERQNELIELIGGGFSEANSYASTLIDKAAA
ncbi:DNA repair protein RecN, ABC transporter [Prochlorococcus marinus str. MIT 9515]|uniref:DNA repair protein RecN n=1 Tax=Prochlorococcus marinus (strain MIT 9515) TaxID=167542 RepID=A2BZA0_PROM5|nr:AAA family ATPase [Prochlorococcus marinus]ABM73111.1 DNA repair protein RecN, ABC transporter [Prochlorococcus marinus str. MIT 9515]